MKYLYTAEEVLNDRDKQFGTVTATANGNKITVTLEAVPYKRHYLGSIVLTGTAGTGGAETLAIKKGSAVAWQENFVIGQDKVRQFQAVPLVGNFGETVTVEASANDLTAGSLFVVYYTK